MGHVLPGTQLARRSPVIGVIVLAHVAFFSLLNGMRIEIPLPQPPATLVPIAPVMRTTPIPPAPPEPSVQETLEVPPPETPVVEFETEAPPPLIADTGPPPADGSPAIAAVADTAPSLDPRRPIGQPPYPAQAIRLDQQGVVRIAVCVRPDGRLTEVTVATSSGYPLLDEAALRHLRKPGIRLRPGTRGGEPVTMCTAIPVRFDIRTR
jgi:protein TonB